MKVRFHPEARSEHLIAAQYYEKKERGLGSRYLAAIQQSVGRIGTSPRSFPVYKGPLLVVAVAHQSREPEYWVDRAT